DVATEGAPLHLRDGGPGQHGGDYEDQAGGGQESCGAPGVEPGQGDPSVRAQLPDEQPGDQEPGDNQEDVHTDEPARGDGGHTTVVEQDEDDRDRPQPLDVGAEPGGRAPCGQAGVRASASSGLPAGGFALPTGGAGVLTGGPGTTGRYVRCSHRVSFMAGNAETRPGVGHDPITKSNAW